MFVSFYIHPNALPYCVVVQNLFYNSVLHDTTTNHTYISIVVFISFTNNDLSGTVKKSQMNMI